MHLCPVNKIEQYLCISCNLPELILLKPMDHPKFIEACIKSSDASYIAIEKESRDLMAPSWTFSCQQEKIGK